MAYFSRRKAVELLKNNPRLKNVVHANRAQIKRLSSNHPGIVSDSLIALGRKGKRNRALTPTILAMLDDPNPGVRDSALLVVSHIGEPKNIKQMSKLLYDKNLNVRWGAIDIFGILSTQHPEAIKFLEERASHPMDTSTFKIMKRALALSKKYNPDFEIYAGLEHNPKFTDKRRVFVRRKQIKDGSISTLFGGKFFKKMRAVRIPKESFNMWEKAFKAGAAVEPIIMKKEKVGRKFTGKKIPRMIRNKDGTITVFAKIIDGVSIGNFIRIEKNHKWFEELKGQVTKIKEKMAVLGIIHGHYHPGNFVVKMINGKPKVYLIDFDRARKVIPSVIEQDAPLSP
ncbi:MAG: HEAT repeat domain-containing protein [Candidatus Diapherotrites archaeon]|nr:HEAT repeat domain-containing protein [Candidatus Diapherotrites archaeon]